MEDSHKEIIPGENNGIQSSRMQILLLVLLAVSFLTVYFQVIQGLVSAWSHSDEFSHGFFIAPIAAYIIWTKKDILARTPIKPSWFGLVVIILSLLFYIVARFAGILTVVSLSMVLFLVGVVLFFYGLQMLKELAFPFFLLLFMIPIPNQIYSMITLPLQLFVSKVSVMVASLFGASVLRQGNVIQLPNQTLEVVQACSGLRSMLTLLTLGIIIAYFSLRSNLLRFVLFISSIPVAIFVNIIRVLVMILAFYYFDIDLSTGTTHTIYGLVIFMLAMVMLIALKGILSFWESSKTLK